MDSGKKKLTLVLGSGFSKTMGVPITSKIPSIFLTEPQKSNLPNKLEIEITRVLTEFWTEIFSYHEGKTPPTLEDHFTLIDLAANSGHYLGTKYGPKKLRAIRRYSILRIFEHLSHYQIRRFIKNFLLELTNKFCLSIVTLNWDLVVERHLKALDMKFYYPIETYKLFPSEKATWKWEGIPIYKMHGSLNWVYCDLCRRVYSGKTRGQAIKRNSFLETDDFKYLGIDESLLNLSATDKERRKCRHCGSILGARVATFSYRKDFSIAQFQTIWEGAHKALQMADTWLMVGYSLPEADFEFLHFLKSAQLAHKKSKWLNIEAVIGGRQDTVKRYKEFFGLNDKEIKKGGLSNWIKENLKRFIEEYSHQ